MKIEQPNRSVLTIKHKYKAGWEQWYLLQSDHHRDNPKCDTKLLLKHLNQAKEYNAQVLMFGDYFCAMQGKSDKRHNKGDVKVEHKRKDYFDALIETEIKFLSPFKNNIALIATGNHESAVLQRNETDLIKRLVEGLNYKGGNVYKGGYGGYVKFMFEREGSASNRSSIVLKYRHSGGSLGGATKGVAGVDKMAKDFPDADIVVTGDNHEAWLVDVVRETVNASGKIVLKEQTHVKTPTYKEEYGDGYGGWHVERNAPPKPLGGMWLRFYVESDEIKYDIFRAK